MTGILAPRFAEWLTARGVKLLPKQQFVGAAILDEFEAVGMVLRGAGKTFLLEQIEEFLSDPQVIEDFLRDREDA